METQVFQRIPTKKRGYLESPLKWPIHVPRGFGRLKRRIGTLRTGRVLRLYMVVVGKHFTFLLIVV